MSSPPVDPRRQEKIRPYKPNTVGQSTSGGEDFICDYMNILGMVFSMCGLMMKLKWCGRLIYFKTTNQKADKPSHFYFDILQHGLHYIVPVLVLLTQGQATMRNR